MHEHLNKPGSGKSSSWRSFVSNQNLRQDIKTDGLESLFVQRVPDKDEDGDDEEKEMEEEEMSMDEPFAVQKKPLDTMIGDRVQFRPLTPFLQMKSNEGSQVEDTISSQIQATRGGGMAMPEPTKDFMQNRFGTDFSNVRIHTDENAARLSTQLSAQAFTVGNDIYFNKGKFSPSTPQGKKLIAHELTHTIQQSSNRVIAQPKVQRSFWSWLKKAAGSVWSGIKRVGEWIGSGIKKVGQWIGAGFKWIWKGIKWLGGQVIDKIAAVFQRIAFWMSQLPARIQRLLSTFWKGLKTFKPWTLKWWKSLSEIDTWKGFLKWLATLALQNLEIVGLGEAYETIMDLIKFNTRVLSPSELKAAKSIFGTSINFDFVRVDTGAMVGPLVTKRAYTSFHTINSWGTESKDVMIHELTHVWQYENAGAIYMPQAVHAQVWGGGYDYGDVANLRLKQRAGEGLLSFNREQQAQIVQDFYSLRQTGSVDRSAATPADLPLYADFVKTVSTLTKTQLLTPV